MAVRVKGRGNTTRQTSPRRVRGGVGGRAPGEVYRPKSVPEEDGPYSLTFRKFTHLVNLGLSYEVKPILSPLSSDGSVRSLFT